MVNPSKRVTVSENDGTGYRQKLCVKCGITYHTKQHAEEITGITLADGTEAFGNSWISVCGE